jgi:hypothetical protein
MKLFFRTLAIVMAALLAVSLVGCGGDDDPEDVVAAFQSAEPADGGSVASNGKITIKFDKNPGTVSSDVGTVSGTGTSRTIAGPFEGDSVTVSITWENGPDGGEGSHTLTYTVTAADETPPTVTDSSPEDGETGVSADLKEVSVTFDETVTGDLMLLDDGDDLKWTQEIDGNTITLNFIAGKELGNETEYTIAGTVSDGAGNETDVDITFTTEAKE